MKETTRKLESALEGVADVLRGQMDASDYRDYILGFIFYKYFTESAFCKLKPQYHFKAIAERAKAFIDLVGKGEELDEFSAYYIIGDLRSAFEQIESSSKEYAQLFDDLDLSASKLGLTPMARNKIICSVINELAHVQFDADKDILGDAYEYLIGQFAGGSGKLAGEFYTPQSVATVMARIVTTGKKSLQSVYDPTCGSGSLLLRVAREVDTVSHFYGQERNNTTFNLARMNLMLHGVPCGNFDLRADDTLENPAHLDQKFDAIVANPPFSAKWSARESFLDDERFEGLDKLPPVNKADYAFVLHMLHHLSEDGILAVVIAHGLLFRGNAEGAIRRWLVETRNVVDAVIGLPANIFFNTSIPTCLIVLRKNRKESDGILFIDASEGFVKVRKKNQLRDEHIDQIVNTYCERKTVDHFSRLVDRKEIEKYDFTLNLRRYVDTFEREPTIDLKETMKKYKEADKACQVATAKVNKYLKELGLDEF